MARFSPKKIFRLRTLVLIVGTGIVILVYSIATIYSYRGNTLKDYLGEKDRFNFSAMVIKELPHFTNLTVYRRTKQYRPGIEELIARNEARVQWADDTCRKHVERNNSQKTFGEVWVSQLYSLAFCIVPKNGCTYWKRILRYLEHDYVDSVEYPDDIDRYDVHFRKLSHIQQRWIDNHKHRNELEPKLKVMFTRDPYARLWSAYLDKFVLPDFWRMGGRIVRETRKHPNTRSLTCGHDVIFAEFVRYNYENRDNNDQPLNEHFQSIVFNCDPCKLKFDIIGKTETFQGDKELVFMNAGLVGKIKEKRTADAKTVEITSLINYNLDIQEHMKTRQWYSQDCFRDIEIAQRLWKVFQYNGYISQHERFPEDELINVKDRNELKEKLKQIILSKRSATDTATLESWSKQREFSMQYAYRVLPKEDLEKFHEMYSLDFELFQYSKYPAWLR